LFEEAMSLFELAPIFLDEEKCVEFLLDRGAFYQARICALCGCQMQLMGSRHSWRCEKRSCRAQRSIRANSFFDNSKLPCYKIMAMGYLWIHRSKITDICSMTGLASATVCAFLKHFRQLVSGHLEEADYVIGGENVIVEVDESKLGKRKYHRGHRVEGIWVVGGIERTAEKRMFIVPVPDRSAATLVEIVKAHVKPGTMVHTDLWKGYHSLDQHGFLHQTVNHSQCLVDPSSGVHTNTIEGAWNGLKMCLAPQHRTKEDMTNRLCEYLWRRQNKGNLWNAFLCALRDTHYEE
jgi:transposase-like protein